MNELNVGLFWKTVAQRATGATVVTATGKNGPAGFLGLSAAHVEANPPTMLVSVGRATSALSVILESGHFAISFLPDTAGDLVDVFGGKSDLHGAGRFREEEWTTLATGAPVFVRSLGVFDCRLDETVERNDAVILIGTVVAATASEAGEPLVLFRNKIRGLKP